jgi:hypothetical protein
MNDWEYRLSVGFGVPLLLAAIGILGKKISRGAGGGWLRSDFYLGREFTLAGVATGLSTAFDHYHRSSPLELEDLLIPFLGLVSFIFVLSLHLQYEDPTNTGVARKTEIQGWLERQMASVFWSFCREWLSYRYKIIERGDSHDL